MRTASSDTVDAVIVGAGHNGLVAAIVLARAGLSVRVLEASDAIGGAARTEQPFAKAPDVKQSTGAYLLGLMPPELVADLGLELPLLRRDPHYFLPTTASKYLLFGSDREATDRQLRRFFSERDLRAKNALEEELAALREDVGPTWLSEPLSIEETADRFVRPTLRKAFVDLCRGSIGDYLDRFGFESELIQAMYAVTDGFTGLFGTWDTPGTGMNFLIHNMCRLPGSDGTWMIVRGGMGTVTRSLAELASRHGAVIERNCPVEAIERDDGSKVRVHLADGGELKTRLVLVNADPFRMQTLLGRERLPTEYNARLDGYRRDGSTLKLNLCLDALPVFRCLPEDHGQHRGTIHLLPEENVIESLKDAFAAVKRGELPDFPAIEWYIHTTVDESLSDAGGRHSAALFVQWVPYSLAGTTWEREEERYAAQLLAICDRFAPGTSSRVVDTFLLTPPKIESHFGITRGHIHHVDNAFGFADRLPYATPVEGVYACGAGCHPGGSVIGAAGFVAARRALADLT